MKIGIYTLGCKVNQYETQAMEQELTARGHELVDFESPADAYIINTCSVTAVSDKKSRQMIRRAKKNSPDAVVAACGCYVQTHEEEAKSLGIDLLMGTNDRARFLDRLEEAVKTRETVADIDDALRRRTFEARGRYGESHTRDAQGRGRLRELLHLLHHSLRARPRALAADGQGGGAGACPALAGLPRACGHGH